MKNGKCCQKKQVSCSSFIAVIEPVVNVYVLIFDAKTFSDKTQYRKFYVRLSLGCDKQRI